MNDNCLEKIVAAIVHEVWVQGLICHDDYGEEMFIANELAATLALQEGAAYFTLDEWATVLRRRLNNDKIATISYSEALSIASQARESVPNWLESR